ncbi:MAG: peptidase [Nitrospinae bacterium CG11_big_fil_rev_8_21_14_0_20_45_15]|nr:MAG: peptidase [Nitrospinae bacterium CG11_big_fil_rev_8_21_14_0_20_45_15]
MPKINPQILKWARETAGLTIEEAVKKIVLNGTKDTTATERLTKLESGETEPTRSLLLKMAKQYHRPLITFYMSSPPRQGDRGQDFRTLSGLASNKANAWLDTLIRNVQARQGVLQAALEDEEESDTLQFIGSMKMEDGVPAVLESIQNTIHFNLSEFCSQRSPIEAFTLLREKVEAIGVFVLLMGDLGSHHTKIDPEIFRGFALANNIAPFVIINDQDSRAAWSFTLLHELTHLWLGQTGVSGARPEKEIEKFCNDVASEFLLPSNELITIERGQSYEEIYLYINHFANSRNLSNSMVAYKLFRRGQIDKAIWSRLNEAFQKLWFESQTNKKNKNKDRTGGPDYYIVRRQRVGTALINHVQRMMSGGILTTTKAGKILGVKAQNVHSLIGL